MPKGTIIKTPTREELKNLKPKGLEYEIVERIGLGAMEEAVNGMIVKGWTPLGGLAVRFSNNLSQSCSEDRKPIYTQALIKEV
jgi:hypothetical protein